MRILNDKNQEITPAQIADIKGAPVPPEVSARERKRQLLQPLFDRLKRLGIGGEAQARTWCEGALAHPLARMADIKEEEIPSLVATAKKALGETEEPPFPDSLDMHVIDKSASFLATVEECIKSSQPVPEEQPFVPNKHLICGTNGCSNAPDESGFCEECGRTETFNQAKVEEFKAATNPCACDTCAAVWQGGEPEPLATSVVPDVEPAAPPQDDKPDPRPSLEVAISSHSSITSGRLSPYITRLRSWNMRKLSPERRKQFREKVSEVEMAWDNLRQELQALAAEGFVAKTSPSTRMAATLRPGDAVTLADSQIVLFGEVYGADELANLKVDAVTDTHAVVSGPLRSLGPVKLCHLAKK